MTDPRPATVHAIWRVAALLREHGADDWYEVDALGRSWLEQYGTKARRWLVCRAMDARKRGADAAAAGNRADAESHYRRAIECYRRAGRWSLTAPIRVWPLRALVQHDLANLFAQHAEHAGAVSLSEREAVPLLFAVARVRPSSWRRSYANVVVDVAEWAYAAADPLLSTYVTRAREAAQQAASVSPSAPVDDARLLLRTHVLDVYVLEDQRKAVHEAGDTDAFEATNRPYATAIATVADQHGALAQQTDSVSDWAASAQLAGIAYRHHHRIGDTGAAVRYLRDAIQRAERYMLLADDPQQTIVEKFADWLLESTDRDLDVSGDHAAIVRNLHRAAELTEGLPRTYQTASHAAGLYALACEQHDKESTRLHKLSEKESSTDRAAELRQRSGTAFVAAAKAGRFGIDLYSEAHHLVEQDPKVTDADGARREWVELELELCDRLCDIAQDLVQLDIAGSNDRLVEVRERAVSVANLAWRLLPDRRPTTAPAIARLLRERARHLIETAPREPAAYGSALDYAMDSVRVEQAHPPAGGPRRSQLLGIAYGLIAAAELHDDVATKRLLEWWSTTHTAMVAAGRRLDAAEVTEYLQQRLPELAVHLADPIPDTPAT